MHGINCKNLLQARCPVLIKMEFQLIPGDLFSINEANVCDESKHILIVCLEEMKCCSCNRREIDSLDAACSSIRASSMSN